MPEHERKQRRSGDRPRSDFMLEAGQLLSEVEKGTVSESNKHVSLLLARSRSLDVLPATSPNSFISSANNPDSNIVTSASPEERDCEQIDTYVTNETASSRSLRRVVSNSAESSSTSTSSTTRNRKPVKDDVSSFVPSHKKEKWTVLKEKSEPNNNSHEKNYSQSSRSSSVSTTSSNCSSRSGGATAKLHRRSSSSSTTTTGGGGRAFQEVVLKEPVRMTGYLEKRSKVLGWKKFWFVLDGRLLTYYKSKADYESLSACCGCINLGIASTVRPIQIRGCKGYPLQIVTRSQVYYLRSLDKPVLEQWLILIQEAASSPPIPSALTSWNSCSGSQYFKNFSSQSQWSLNNSTEDFTDITERLGNLPDTFYEKRDRGSLIFSKSQPAPVIQKYHSFASLQTPVVNNFGGHRGRKVLLSSNENLRDLHDEDKSRETMQQSTSLLVLDSSPQAAELRKELTRKLSIGSASKKNKLSNESSSGPDTAPTPTFLLSKRRPDGGDDELHHYDEIGDYDGNKHYENSGVESLNFSMSKKNHVASRGGRSVDEAADKDGNIYEQIETTEPHSIWEPLTDNVNSGNSKRLPHRLSAGSNRNSLVSISELPEDVSSISPSPAKTPMLASIPEASWRAGVEPYKNYGKIHSEDELSSCRSESFQSLPCPDKPGGKKKKAKAFTGFLSKVFGKKGKSKSESHESSMVISGPVDLRYLQQSQPAAFTDNLERKSSFTKSNESHHSTVQEQEPVAKSSPVLPGSKMTVNNTNVMDELKQKVGHISLKRTNSRSNTSLESTKESGQSSKSQQKPPQEPRVPYIPRPATVGQAKPSPVLVLQQDERTMESSTDDDDLCKGGDKETQMVFISISPEVESNNSLEAEKPPPPMPETISKSENKPQQISPVSSNCKDAVKDTSSVRMRRSDMDDFQHKLAKFNRLSQSLNASFMAAFNPPPSHSTHSQMGRSHSCKGNRNKTYPVKDDILPPLPPKKKNNPNGGSFGAISPLYDVPLNNKPVAAQQQSTENVQEERSIAEYVRSLTKKNSTPDIVLSGNAVKPFLRDISDPSELHKALHRSNESVDAHKSNPFLPPPRPPKPKPPAKPKSLDLDFNRSRRSSTNSNSPTSSQTLTNPSLPSVASNVSFDTPQSDTSPVISNKSLDIDTLDGLSDADLSDTKLSCTPPDTPKICLIHPEACLGDDSVLSSIATTPDFTHFDRMVPDSLATTPDAEVFLGSASNLNQGLQETDSDTEPISINKLEIVIRDNDGSPGIKSPDCERLDSLERVTCKPAADTAPPEVPNVYQNLKFATVHTLIQEFETVEENEDEVSELYDDFPAEFYTPTPSSFSGYSPSEVSTTSSSDTSSLSSASSTFKKHAPITAIPHTAMEQLGAFLSSESASSSEECSFESCTDNFPEETLHGSSSTSGALHSSINNNNNNNSSFHKVTGSFHPAGSQDMGRGTSRTGAISRLGHSSAVGHLQKILSNDIK